MKRKRLIAFAIICLVLLAAVIGLHQWYSHRPPPQRRHVRNDVGNTTRAAPAVTVVRHTDVVDPARPVDPTLELKDLIQNYEHELVLDGEQKVAFATMIAQWTALKKAGKTRWGSEKWMKAPEYYAGLDTPALAGECFLDGNALFGVEMGIYNEPLAGLESLRVFHNGFAELLKREDMWKGILHVYDPLSSEITPQADLLHIIRASVQLDALQTLYGLAPLRDQVKGREGVFLAAHVRVLKTYKRYLDSCDLTKPGAPGFFREPCSVAEVALLLAKQIDPQGYARIEPAITSVRWTREQKVEDLKSFISLVLDGLDQISTKGGDMAR